jgi:hypothetical protein
MKSGIAWQFKFSTDNRFDSRVENVHVLKNQEKKNITLNYKNYLILKPKNILMFLWSIILFLSKILQAFTTSVNLLYDLAVSARQINSLNGF